MYLMPIVVESRRMKWLMMELVYNSENDSQPSLEGLRLDLKEDSSNQEMAVAVN